MTPDPVTLVGTGALASLLGARLARSGCAVTLAGTWREAIETVNRHGLAVEDSTGSWSAPAKAVFISDRLEPADLVLVLVKSPRTQAVADAATRAAAPFGLILTLQNGLGNFETLAGARGTGLVAVGVALLGATLLAPAHVRDGGGSQIMLQRTDGIDRAADALRKAGFEISLEWNITPTLWGKLAANCAINPLTALLRVPNGALLEDVRSRSTLESAAREVGAVAAALGISLTEDPAEAAVEVARRTAMNRSSMLQDVERGVPTEIEALNGTVVRKAEQLGVPVPVNRLLLEEVRRLSAVARKARPDGG